MSRYFKGPARHFYEDLSFSNSITRPGVNSTLPSPLFIYFILFIPSPFFTFQLLFIPSLPYYTIIIAIFSPYFRSTLQAPWFKTGYSIVPNFYSPIFTFVLVFIHFLLFIYLHILPDSLLFHLHFPLNIEILS